MPKNQGFQRLKKAMKPTFLVKIKMGEIYFSPNDLRLFT